MTSTVPALLALAALSGAAHAGDCSAQSPATRTPVIELYTSEGCSSCPPADRWLSGLKVAAGKGQVVAQAFHVGYWDYIGWVDRFASPAFTARQRELASRYGRGNVYTPQLVRDGQDSRNYALAAPAQPAGANIKLLRMGDAVEAEVSAGGAWSAYWTVTEHGHASKVTAGENSGESLRHDFVVRQYVPVGQYQGAQKLKLRPIAPTAGHPQQVNLVVTDAKGGQPLQALSLACS